MSALNTWTGRPVNESRILYDELNSDHLPKFQRLPFQVMPRSGRHNPYLDMIVNEESGIPVATVSKSYGLVQHHEALDVTVDALKDLNLNPDNAECELAITEHGERMWLRIRFPEHHFDPGDGHPMYLELSLFNSVDRSLIFGFEGGWYREICKNGMVALTTGARMNKRHSKAFSADFLADQLNEKFVAVLAEEEQYKKWIDKKVEVGSPMKYHDQFYTIEDWLNETVTGEWGRRTATRAFHIIERGVDGNPLTNKSETEAKATEIPLKSDGQTLVPGAKPTENLLDVNHALTWLASHQETVQTRYEMMRDVPGMIDVLSKNL